MRAAVFGAAAAIAAALGLVASGCTTNAYCFECGSSEGGSGLTGSSSSGGLGGSGGSSSGDIFIDGGMGQDAAGGGGPDSGCGADLMNDAKNCGACGNVCSLLGAFPKCAAGVCAIDACADGHVDLNGIASDGCEYLCSPTNMGAEICDAVDNNCNGVIDEGFDLTNDPMNCGECGNVCALANATAACAVVLGIPRCVVEACADGYKDIDGVPSDGCEYMCPVSPPAAEACNDKDDDCDGQINEGNPGGGLLCETNCPGGTCMGECKPGVTVCAGTSLVCVGGAGPSLEVCDGLDNDCDGAVDNGFDLQADPQNCGACGAACMLDHAVGGCMAGQCVITTCLPGYKSLDNNPANGCEYACPVNPPTVESCNGLDDDCNGVTDDAGVISAQKPPAALCYPTPGTPCAGSDFVCQGALGWRCSYGAGVEVDPNGKLAVVESLCNGIDGNCNGQVDETWQDLGTPCDNGQLGACRDGGMKICDPVDPAQTICDLSPAPDPVPGAPSAEACNGVDDDCDGVKDNNIADDMVEVNFGGLHFFIDRYEASRPDATSATPGFSEQRRCVTADRIPWTFAAQAEAATTCAATGHRLCTGAEMQAACATVAGNAYPYGMAYSPSKCNGLDYDGVPGGQDNNILLPTGSAALLMCSTPTAIFDLSGNANEWTSTVTGNTGAPKNLPIYMAKGGSYLTPAAGLTCQFTLSRYASEAILPELGFRCCKDP